MKMLKMIGMAIIAFLMTVGFASCSNDDKEITEDFSIVGTWQGTTNQQTEIYVFTSDGNYTREVKGSNKQVNKGTYLFSKNTLTLNEWSDREGYASFNIKVKVVSSKEMIWTSEKDSSTSYTLKKM